MSCRVLRLFSSGRTLPTERVGVDPKGSCDGIHTSGGDTVPLTNGARRDAARFSNPLNCTLAAQSFF